MNRLLNIGLGMLIGLSASMAYAQCQACGYSGDRPQCYATPTGIDGNTGCANLASGGCVYSGQVCSNGYQGPPTLGDACMFNYFWDPYWWNYYCVGALPPYLVVCAPTTPTLQHELLFNTPLPRRSIRLIRTIGGEIIRLETL